MPRQDGKKLKKKHGIEKNENNRLFVDFISLKKKQLETFVYNECINGNIQHKKTDVHYETMMND